MKLFGGDSHCESPLVTVYEYVGLWESIISRWIHVGPLRWQSNALTEKDDSESKATPIFDDSTASKDEIDKIFSDDDHVEVAIVKERIPIYQYQYDDDYFQIGDVDERMPPAVTGCQNGCCAWETRVTNSMWSTSQCTRCC